MPVLLLLKGQPGSGKSVLGRALAAEFSWAVVDKDDSRDAFQAASVAFPGVDWNSLAYDVMFSTAATQLECGLGVIFDCPLARKELFDRAAAMAQRYQSTLALVECNPSDETMWRERLEARGQEDKGTEREHKPGSWEAVQRCCARTEQWSEQWSESVDLCRVCIDTTTGSTQEHVATVLQALQQHKLV